ncbi:hypothetical protein JCM19232_1310 [Vibrio ishigakensis]|uniref:DUF3024 domain-containing protein n=1 Tax=Vibrio ishigakensis TaxID=1481914 RepID=A0A0B8PJA2_9VIBR|nr:DUF3024 domain-containing protein [Vibrio ishigakensis]GAM55251.1 hypothetical protein JCM19231_5083 [Vibrio ishigakensis]GAM63163.1 hypothetical protein JCM19232_1310 [Vibrio ishigakensis]GAM68109.1 hypothetical protein JCM19236_2264 [Vibrio sp. JCM 19236]GAM73957.1 hypothetical protein JCM19241_5153 [Vibrio ishigakensis]
MELSELEKHQVQKLALQVCNARNHNLPVEIGKADFAILDNGVEFSEAHFKLDSTQCDYRSLVAKIIRLEESWQLMLAQRDKHQVFERWYSYPESVSNQLHALMKEVEQDPNSLIW